MKHLTIILMIVFFANFTQAQSNKYPDLWKKVEKLEVDGLPKSALEIVDQISVIAEKEKNATQQVKVLLYKSKYALTLEEDAQLKIISDYKSTIEKNKFPIKNILESQLATLYWQFFQQNRYKFYNRTKTEAKVDEIDFRTWDLQTLFTEIQLHYTNSLQNGLLAQQTPLDEFDYILQTVVGSKKYRPTLFDFLNHQALQFFKTEEQSITKPAYKFEINQASYLSDSKTFSRIQLTSKDESSQHLQGLKIYQSLIKFHLKSNNQFALAEANIERIDFVNQHAIFTNKESIYYNTLINERQLVKEHEVSALYGYKVAALFNQQSQEYKPLINETNRWKKKEALALCNSILEQFPKSKGAEKCTVLKHRILLQSLTITNETFIATNTPSRVLVQFKNIDALDFKMFSISRNQLKKLNNIYKKDEQYLFINKLSLVNQWHSTFRNEGDYQNHSSEILVPKLENGTFIILATTNETESKTFSFSSLQVSQIALVEKNDEEQHIFQVIDRENGQPITNASVKFSFTKKHKGRTHTNQYVTDSNGEFNISTTNGYYSNIFIEVKKEGETAYFDNLYINDTNRSDKTEKIEYRSFLFTDRSIYRPGQTVYFKGISMKIEEGKSSVLSNQKVSITLYDVNHTEVKELELTTNDFGSVSGEFTLPNSGLTGQYHIEIDADLDDFYTEQYFSVEEYKRPKFETKFDPVTDTFKVNDSVTIKGNALAYAGSTITDAKVVYRVHRNIQYPSWFYWYRPWFNSEPQEITHGETITNSKGEFEITFKAQPDESVNKDNLPVFTFEVTADVTDINGETRSTSAQVKVGYHALLATIHCSNKFDKLDKKQSISIVSQNLNGEYAPAKGSIAIYKLSAPKQVLRKRPWEAPDYQDISETDFNRLFPNDTYTNEDDIKNWKKGTRVLSEDFDTEISKEIALGKMKRWESGKYIIELESQDQFGQTVKDIKYVDLYSMDDENLSDNQLFSIQTNKPNYKEGENAQITVTTAAKNLSVTIDIEKDKKIVNTYVLQLNNNKKTISVPVEKDDLGGFAVHYSYAAFNSYKNGSVIISVPHPKTNLEIETLTFRDKLQPGEEETWSFKIKGPNGDQVSAEILASMYDASLDQFKSHQWGFNPIYQPTYHSLKWGAWTDAAKSFGVKTFRTHLYNDRYPTVSQQGFDSYNWFGLYFGNRNIRIRGASSTKKMNANTIQYDDDDVEASPMLEETVVSALSGKTAGVAVEKSEYELNGENIPINGENGLEEKPSFDDVVIRKNLQETAFFFPHLKTDTEGNVSFSFTSPEALTKWKLQLLAHTKTLESATTSLELVTQKELMVIPNAPRFLREGDQIQISTKIANLSEKQLQGVAVLQLFDAMTGKSIDQELSNTYNDLGFTVEAKGNTSVFWNLTIPEGMQAVQYKVIAKAGDFSDGEQNVLPVLSNRMLVTETLPMWVRSNQTKTFSLDKLKNNTSTTLKHHQLTLEMTSNPAWYAVQALPYLMEYPYDCNEQTFSRYYANALASHIAISNPRIQEVFNLWKNTDALESNLEKNQELKSLLIQETPWLRDAQSESEQKKRIALLFDLNKMNSELSNAQRKLNQNQLSNGAWPWFNGGRESRYITQHIITGYGHLKQLNVTASEENSKMIKKAVQYLDAEFVREYKNLKKYNNDIDLSKDHLSYTQLHYLYMRSFFSDIKTSKEVETIQKYYSTQIEKYWLSRTLYAKGLMALVMHRNQEEKVADKILRSLKENSITSDELGMYWKENTSSWYWYQAPIETQALLIEAFSEIDNDTETIDNLKIWLLKNKQTNQWKTTKSTTEAVYALLLQGSDWLSVTEMVDVLVGNQVISPSKLENVKVEAGTGYYKTSWKKTEITSEMADVQLTKKGDGIAWGAMYWQYFEDLDKITSAETPLTLKKKLFLKENTDVGEEMAEITTSTKLNVGDLVRVRIELTSDRAMEFVHMKDMRAAGFEPINVISKYKWQDGLGYYESTKDASTNFFFDYLPKGVYVFEYDVRVNNAGNFSNGITTIQSMYAPEFSSHSEGIRVMIE